ncbi:decapping 5-like protein isoform X2 [Diospyros lotus]|uniref:decapping 5-like protein isoform X2 n=1 Tax=Diospyros lotus TaxID=55363 RepID=UPI00225BA92A|nr:decapping 5-like protein isoform X2 [Diospyros lotus]
MANESSSSIRPPPPLASMPSSSSPSPSPSTSTFSVDSYIGSFISLTSKFEIRYEGVLYYLNPQDSTLGLKNVRSFGTEGRKKDGPQVPPSDKVYEYILFRGNDIKDLQVKSSPPVQREELIQNDPAIIKSHSLVGASNLSKSVSVGSGSLAQLSPYQEPFTSANLTYPIPLPSYQSGNPVGSLQSTQNVKLSTSPTYWPGYNEASSNIPYATQFSNPLVPSSSTTTSLPAAMQTYLQPSTTLPSTASGLMYPSDVAPASLLTTSSSVHLNVTPALAPEQPSYSSTLSVQSLPYSTSSIADSASAPLIKLQHTLLTPDQLAQTSPSLLSSVQNPHSVEKDMLALDTASVNLPSLVTTSAVQAPLLPLPPSTQQFTEEFDFEAMNEKFKKEEVWGYLGAKNGNQTKGIEENAGGQNFGHMGAYGLVLPKLDPKPAYKKDEFFDTLSRKSFVQGNGPRNGHNRFSERMKQDTETFGSFHQRPHLWYGGYGAGRSDNYRGSYSRGRGYNYHGRGGGNWHTDI